MKSQKHIEDQVKEINLTNCQSFLVRLQKYLCHYQKLQMHSGVA